MKTIDKIRSASPERLARWLSEIVDCGFCNCCGDELFSEKVNRKCDGDCEKCAVEWLNAECEAEKMENDG